MNGERKERRGFASMSPEKQREIASKGGRAAHQKGTAHEWTSDEARQAGFSGWPAPAHVRTWQFARRRRLRSARSHVIWDDRLAPIEFVARVSMLGKVVAHLYFPY